MSFLSCIWCCDDDVKENESDGETDPLLHADTSETRHSPEEEQQYITTFLGKAGVLKTQIDSVFVKLDEYQNEIEKKQRGCAKALGHYLQSCIDGVQRRHREIEAQKREAIQKFRDYFSALESKVAEYVTEELELISFHEEKLKNAAREIDNMTVGLQRPTYSYMEGYHYPFSVKRAIVSITEIEKAIRASLQFEIPDPKLTIDTFNEEDSFVVNITRSKGDAKLTLKNISSNIEFTPASSPSDESKTTQSLTRTKKLFESPAEYSDAIKSKHKEFEDYTDHVVNQQQQCTSGLLDVRTAVIAKEQRKADDAAQREITILTERDSQMKRALAQRTSEALKRVDDKRAQLTGIGKEQKDLENKDKMLQDPELLAVCDESYLETAKNEQNKQLETIRETLDNVAKMDYVEMSVGVPERSIHRGIYLEVRQGGRIDRMYCNYLSEDGKPWFKSDSL